MARATARLRATVWGALLAEFRVFGRLVPNPFVLAVLVPAATFLALYLWPFLEQRLARDRDTTSSWTGPATTRCGARPGPAPSPSTGCCWPPPATT